MPGKTPWESRVMKLCCQPDFVYAYKPVDSPFHGGAARIDIHACDIFGRYWLIEVKSLGLSRKSFTISDVTPLQQQGLDDVGLGVYSVPILAVGHQDKLYLWNWRNVRTWQEEQRRAIHPGLYQSDKLLPLDSANIIYQWHERQWGPAHTPLFGVGLTSDAELDIRLTKLRLERSSLNTERSPLTLRPQACPPIIKKTLKSVPSSSRPEVKVSSSVSSRSGGTKSLKTARSGRSDRT